MDQDPNILLRKAEKAHESAKKSWGWLGGREEKFENAANLYKQAANAFQLQDQDKVAGGVYERAAQIHIEDLDELSDAAQNLEQAYQAYTQSDPDAASRVMVRLIQYYDSAGKKPQAADRRGKLAAAYEKEGRVRDALEMYEEAGKRYSKLGNSTHMANRNFLKVAELSAIEEDYLKAIHYFSEIGKESVDNNLMRFSVHEYFFKAGICHMAQGGDVVTRTNEALEEYVKHSPDFSTRDEHKLLVNMLQAFEAGDEDAFSVALEDFDRIRKLDKWKTTMLLRIKKQIPGDPMRRLPVQGEDEVEEDFS